jgi:murein DD-endopeptidase MepM/ murein hydrolase activator NlpD
LRLKDTRSAESKEKFNESFRKALNLPDKTAVDAPNPNATPEEKLKNSRFSKLATNLSGVSVKAAGLANIAGIACLAYDTTRAISGAVKLAKYSAYAAVALTFFNAASKLKAGDAGGIDPAVMTELGNRLTATNVNTTDGSAGLSATDSYGYKAAMYGDNGAMPEYAKDHSMESAGLLGAMSSIMKFFTGVALARTVAHNICGIANGPLGVAIACMPAAETGPGVLGCIGIQILIAAGLSIVIAQTMPTILQWLIDATVKMPDETTAGAQLGDVLYPGGAAILGAQASSYGMAPGTKEQISSYVAAGEEIHKQSETIARMDAKERPFDIYNQYSFLGSMVRNMNVTAYSNASLTRASNLLFAALPHSLANIVTNAHAGTYMPLAENKAEQYGKVQCPEVDFTGETNSDCCPSLALIGAVGDGYCMPAYVKSTDEMNSDPDATLDFMINGEYIDEDTGEPRTDTDHGKQFQKYLDYCPFRTEGWGETAKSIAEGGIADYEWYIGAVCNKDTDDTAVTGTKSVTEMIRLNPVISLPTDWLNGMAEDNVVQDDIKNFRNYTMDEPVNATLAGEDTVLKHSPLPATPGDTPVDPNAPTENSGNVVEDGWTFPTTAGAALVSPFGPRGGGFHTGVDLGVPSGSPFYATRDGVVLTREFNIYSIAGGSWCPVVPSESPIQKDIWITHNVNGVTYTSIYAHMSKFLVANGATVKAGDLIGYTGGSGCSSGPHVHFEIWQSGSPNPGVPSAAALDPWPLINP